MPTKYHLIVDLEATCCNDQSFPRVEMEIIEIGAVMVDGASLEIESEFQTFIRPVRNPELTEFCKELTNISQEFVDAAPGFKEAIGNFKAWLGQFENFDFCSWGHYDRKQFEQDCEFHAMSMPMDAIHRNLKVEFSAFLGVSKGYGMSKALKRIGVPLEGTHHRGIDDARNITKIFKHMQENQKSN